MASNRGRASVDAFFASAPERLIKVLAGAGRAGGKVIADEAKSRVTSDAVREDIRTRVKTTEGLIVVTVDVKKGWGRSLGTWLEYGTDPHLISVDDRQSGGRTVRRINMLAKSEGSHSLVIGGKFVGATIMHPGARPAPFLRPALDIGGQEAIATAQAYLNARVGRAGVNTSGIEGDDA